MLEKIFKKNEIKFIAIFIIFVFIFLAIIFILAIIIDPYSEFGTNIIKPIVMTHRTEKVNGLREFKPSPEILILGSSRMFTANPDQIYQLTKQVAFNASVGYGRAEDYWSIFNYTMHELNITPKLLIIGFNVGAFNNDDIETELINNKNLNKYLVKNSETNKILSILKTFKGSINATYIKDMMVALFKIQIKTDKKNIYKGAEFLKNGMMKASVDNLSNQNLTLHNYNLAYNLFKDQNINPLRKLYLENLIGFANQNNVKVKLILLPMPPDVISKLERETNYKEMYQNLVTYIDELHLAYNFKFYDFSTIDKFDGFEEDFSDATHPGSKNIEKITELIFQEKNNL